MNVIPNKKIWFTFSGLLVMASLIVILGVGLPLGIDFTGGSLIELEISSPDITPTQVTEALSSLTDVPEIVVQAAGINSYILRSSPLTQAQHESIIATLRQTLPAESRFEELRFESIGPVLGAELKTKSLVALVVASVGIILFIAWSFRQVSKPVASWKYGITAVIALVHDVLITTGVFTVLAHVSSYQINALFITALLVTLGYSVNDTIVVFDRTRENLKTNPDTDFMILVNNSINQTLSRSINSSLTTILVLLALFILGGQAISGFVLALMIGVIIGTYSSIFLASPLLTVWAQKKSA